MSNQINFKLNGQCYISNNNLTIYQLLNYFNYDLALIVLEYNGTIYSKKKWVNLKIQSNDQFEVITIVGGG
jgi:thiamine biosynthesis protein ThiS